MATSKLPSPQPTCGPNSCITHAVLGPFYAPHGENNKKIKNRCFTHATSGAHKWAKRLHHPCHIGVTQCPACEQNHHSPLHPCCLGSPHAAKMHSCHLGVPNTHRGDKSRNDRFNNKTSETYTWARWRHLPAGLQLPNAYCGVEFQLPTSVQPSPGATCGQICYISLVTLWAN